MKLMRAATFAPGLSALVFAGCSDAVTVARVIIQAQGAV